MPSSDQITSAATGINLLDTTVYFHDLLPFIDRKLTVRSTFLIVMKSISYIRVNE